MATTSEVKSGLQSISDIIAGANSGFTQAITKILALRNQLNDIPTQYSDVISTVDGYTPTGAFETLAKDEKTKLQTEFVALRTMLESALTDLGVPFS